MLKKRKQASSVVVVLLVILVLIAAAAVVVALSGCGAREIPKKVELVIVGGPRANIPRISTNTASVNELLYDASYSYGSVTFITCDGMPHVYASVDIPEPKVHGMDEAALRKRADDYTDQLSQLVGQGKAESPESDLLGAIQLASQKFAGADEDSRCVLVILDSGLSTERLDFRQKLDTEKGTKEQYMLSAVTESVVAQLDEECELPKLNGADVYFSFCGVTAQPQEPLSEKQKEKLRDIWEAILMAGGAASVEFTNDFATNVAYEDDLPAVSTVPVEAMKISPESEAIETIVLDESSVRFIGDTADYIDPEAAREELGKVADLLLSNPENKVYLVGTTATGRQEYTQELSERRALAVKETLTELGVPEERMEPVGLGCTNYWHKDDTDENGHHIEEIASLNRAVLVIDTKSDDGDIVRAEMEVE